MSTKKWRPEITVQFVEEYEKYPCLWDPNNRNYKRREMRTIALQHIISALAKQGIKMTPEGAKSKIRNLRNTYINELRKMADSKLSGTDKVYKTSLYWFKEADRFLRSVVKIPDTVAQNCDVDSDEDEIIDDDVIIELLQTRDGSQEEGGQPQITNVQSEDYGVLDCSPQPPTLVCEKRTPIVQKLPSRKSPEPENSKRKLSPDRERLSRNLSADIEKINRGLSVETERPQKLAKPSPLLDTDFSLRSTDFSRRTHLSDDYEFDIFGQSIALQMKKLPLEHALELQAEIHNAIVQRRLKVLRKAAQRQVVGSSSENRSSYSKGTSSKVPEDVTT